MWDCYFQPLLASIYLHVPPCACIIVGYIRWAQHISSLRGNYCIVRLDFFSGLERVPRLSNAEGSRGANE